MFHCRSKKANPFLPNKQTFIMLYILEGSRHDAVAKALAPHQCGLGSILGPVTVESVVGSRPCSEGFSLGYPVFLPPQKPISPAKVDVTSSLNKKL